MKRLFLFLTVIAAMATVMISCSKDDDESENIQQKKLTFANALTQNSTSCAWEGLQTEQHYSWGNWSDHATKYFIMRYDRTSTEAINGTGWAYVFKTQWKEEFIEKTEFTWRFNDTNSTLEISYRAWNPVHAEYNTTELTIKGNTFVGTWFESSDCKYQFEYKKSDFNDWEKY